MFGQGSTIMSHVSIRVTKTHPEAEKPFKEIDTDVAWDVTIVNRCDSRAEDIAQEVNTFSTGLVIDPPTGKYLEVIPHPTLYKAGYMFANSPIIINPGNEEELILPLFKYKDTEDIELPFRAAQIVLHSALYTVIYDGSAAPQGKASKPSRVAEEEVDFIKTTQTKRGAGKKQTKSNHMF